MSKERRCRKSAWVFLIWYRPHLFIYLFVNSGSGGRNGQSNNSHRQNADYFLLSLVYMMPFIVAVYNTTSISAHVSPVR